jgi:hypothetical protein
MATVFRPPTASPISLAACAEWLDVNLRPEDPESMLEAAGAIAGLAANQSFLFDFICDGITHPTAPYQGSNTYTDHTIILHTGANYHLRANVWLPTESYGTGVKLTEDIHAYHLAHNHNFHFLTVGYHGPGYRTLIARHDPISIVGEPIGQKANLHGHHEVQLERGLMIAFDAHTDVHNQIPPESLSISLNLMPNQNSVMRTEQFEYNLEKDTVIGYIRGHVTQRGKLIKMLGALGGGSYIPELRTMALSFPCARTRLMCMRELLRLGALDDTVRFASLEDSSSLVQEWARKAVVSATGARAEAGIGTLN